MADNRYCSGCLRDDEENDAEAWCSDCSEVVCRICAKVHKRFDPPHKVVPLDQVSDLSASLLQISKHCDVHTDQKIVLFCTQHDEVICDLCHSDFHTNCKSVKSIDRAAKGAKTGTALEDLQKRMMNLREILQSILKSKKENSASLDKQKQDILKQISDIRRNIDEHLDKIENEIKEHLENKYSECKTNINYDRKELESRNDDIHSWMEDVRALKSSASEIHFFKVIKVLDGRIHKEEIGVRGKTKLKSLEWQPNKSTTKLSEIFESIGKIFITQKDIQISTKQDKAKQGQIPRGVGNVGREKFLPKSSERTRSYERQTITRVCQFNTSVLGANEKVNRGCFISDREVLLPSRKNPYLYVCNNDGSEVEKIILEHEPWSLAMIDDKHVIITLANYGYQLLDLTTRTLGEPIKPSGRGCLGASCSNGQIWIKTEPYRLSQIDIRGRILRAISTKEDPHEICLNDNGTLYYTTNMYGEDNVHRVTVDGQDSVIYNNTYLRTPTGFTVDDSGHVYVAGGDSENIHRISPDGHGQVVLTKTDGIRHPRGLCYNNQTHELLVNNNTGQSVVIFKVK